MIEEGAPFRGTDRGRAETGEDGYAGDGTDSAGWAQRTDPVPLDEALQRGLETEQLRRSSNCRKTTKFLSLFCRLPDWV
jgi:hypothetical protein